MVLETILQVVADNVTTAPAVITAVTPSTLELLNALISNVYLLLAAITALIGGPLGAFIFKSFKNGKEIQATANTYALMFNNLYEDNAKTKSILKIALTLAPEEAKKYLEKPEVRAVIEGTTATVGTLTTEIDSVSKGMPQGARAMVRHAAAKMETTVN